MNIREGILDSLVDGGESIVQITEYLEYLKIQSSRSVVVNEIKQLLRQKKIYIEYPSIAKGMVEIEVDKIEDYWFELTESGRLEWDRIRE